MDTTDRNIINTLQGGFPISETPFAEVAVSLGVGEDELMERIARLRDNGDLSRFGPMYNADRLGGATTLAAMAVPAGDFERVAATVNAHPEVAHNYAREHELNMWFVVATEDPGRIDEVIGAIESETGLAVYSMPKTEEFYVGLRFEV